MLHLINRHKQPGTPGSSIHETNRTDITKILLKLVLNTIAIPQPLMIYSVLDVVGVQGKISRFYPLTLSLVATTKNSTHRTILVPYRWDIFNFSLVCLVEKVFHWFWFCLIFCYFWSLCYVWNEKKALMSMLKQAIAHMVTVNTDYVLSSDFDFVYYIWLL